jgi:hypothetical protein
VNLVRKLKISKLTTIAFSPNEKAIVDSINSVFEDLTEYIEKIDTIDRYSYKNSAGKVLFYRAYNTVYISASYTESLKNNYDMNDSLIKEIFSYYLTNFLKEKITISRYHLVN